MTADRLTPQRETEIRERIAKRTAEFTEWMNKYSPMPGQEICERAEAVLEEDVPALLAELAAVRAERDALAKRLHDAAMTRTWRNEDGKKFVFVEDIAPALLGITPGTEATR
ncbi:hypothetical protein AAW14_06045 [Streptomyces hygroscopicus]|uniref:hypothetical protein n=1 Tax=Streptomyces hygroscopicus TaxID=1912 RepID=UPI0022407F34|nr:hypothetical protein [Streptomyces hygroscopicus]MCW7941607.1 hypothetical protein [Streptomyces hygroscopicus]